MAGTGLRAAGAATALPPGWRWVRLGALVADAKAGFACGARDANGVIQLRMNNVDTRGNFVWDEFIRIPADPETVDQYRLLPGDVVFNNTNSTELVGKSALFEAYREPVVYSNHFTRLRTHADRLAPAFLAAWLNLRWQQGTFARICNRWIGQSAVKADKLLKLDFPLPPLAEQMRISGVLQELLAAVERARAAADARSKAAKRLPAAYLRSVFEGGMIGDCPLIRLGELAELLPSRSISTAGDTEVRAITTGCLSELGFVPAGIKDARMSSNDARECRAVAGEVLVARSNTAELVGRASVYPGQPANVVASDLTIRIWPRRAATPTYLGAYLSYLYLTGYWRERAGGASGSMKKITREQIKALLIPVPPTQIQDRIGARLAERMAAVAAMGQALEAEGVSLGSLAGVLLRRGFSGGL